MIKKTVQLSKPYRDNTYVNVHYVKARKDYPAEGIKKGDHYYWWRFPFGNTMRMLTKPRMGNLMKNTTAPLYTGDTVPGITITNTVG